MSGWEILRGWYDSPGLLASLRTLFTYTSRSPDRATGWLYLPDQPPVTPWPPVLATEGPRLLARLEASTGIRFTACCFQAYLNGSGVGWHHDRTWDVQAILSLGVTRTFGIRRVGGGPAGISAPAFVSGAHADAVSPVAGPPVPSITGLEFPLLHHGDLLYMAPGFQDEWEHCVPVEPVQGERCSLVFRTPKG